MAFADTLTPEFVHETTTTRKLLERIPEVKLGWKPHAKSMTLGGLATHLAQIPYWAGLVFSQDEFDMAAPGSPPLRAALLESRNAILDKFDAHVKSARAALASQSDADLMKPWTLKKGGEPVFILPRAAVFRSMVMNHSIHHRGQLSVYLRLNNVPLPAIYGPSADEGF